MRIVCLFLLSLLSYPALAEINVFLNRHTADLQDMVRLTIEITQSGQPQRPDLAALSSDFYLLGSRKMTISNRQAGDAQTTTRWQVLLRPRRTGELSIPSFNLPGSRPSLPLTVTVTGDAVTTTPGTAPATAASPQHPEFILSNTIDHTEAYAGSQLIYHVRLLHQSPLAKNSALTEPYLDQALVLPLGAPRETQTQVRGVNYYLREQRYAIFPDSAGTYQIEPPVFSATDENGRYMETRGEPVRLDIIPPANSNSQGYWLPASNLKLEDTLEQPERLEPGMSLTRTITLKAHGLPASRLPALSVLKNELATVEVLDIALNEEHDEQGIIGVRQETLRITVKERGEVTLPPIDVHWWDTYEDRGKVSSLPPRLLNVEGASRANTSPVATKVTPLMPETAKNDTADAPSSISNATSVPLIVFLASISIISSLGWLYTYHRLRRLGQYHVRKREALTERQREKRERTQALAEKNTYQALSMACQQNNADMARSRLIEWAQRFWPEHEIHSTDDISHAAHNHTLDFLIIDLEQHISAQEQQLWQGDLLWQAINTLRQRRYGTVQA